MMQNPTIIVINFKLLISKMADDRHLEIVILPYFNKIKSYSDETLYAVADEDYKKVISPKSNILKSYLAGGPHIGQASLVNTKESA